MDDEKPRRQKRVNRKRQALKSARQKFHHKTKIWAACLDTELNLWRSFVLDCNTKTIVASGELVEGKDESYSSLTNYLTSSK